MEVIILEVRDNKGRTEIMQISGHHNSFEKHSYRQLRVLGKYPNQQAAQTGQNWLMYQRLVEMVRPRDISAESMVQGQFRYPPEYTGEDEIMFFEPNRWYSLPEGSASVAFITTRDPPPIRRRSN